MHFTTLILSALAATTAIAAPAAEPVAGEIEARTQPLIDLWQDPGFLGLKFTGSANPGDCENLPGTGFNNNVSSAKAKPGWRCTVWVAVDCLGTGFSFNSDGASSFPSWIDNRASSWKCVQ